MAFGGMSALAQASYEFQKFFASNEFLKRILENNTLILENNILI